MAHHFSLDDDASALWPSTGGIMSRQADVLRVGVGGPVGSGKTALVDSLCKRMRERFDIAVVTNDIYTREDCEFLIRSQALPAERIRGVETGGCPQTATREDASMSLAAIDELMREFTRLDMIIVEIGGDNLAATSRRYRWAKCEADSPEANDQ